MAPLVLLATAEGHDVIVAKRAGWSERVAARLCATQLDTALALGAAPTRPALALRAQHLGGDRTRQRLGRSIRRVLHDARARTSLPAAQVRTRRDEVLAAAGELDQIAEALLSPGPIAASGVAQVRLLLTDGASPLYHRDAPEGLRAAATRALHALQPAFQWNRARSRPA